MTARDDLGRDLQAAYITAQLTEPDPSWSDLADRLQSYGWRPAPPRLRTVDEVDALPLGAVVLLRVEGNRGQERTEVWQRLRRRKWYSPDGFGPLKTSEIVGDSYTTRFVSATVLWTPEAGDQP